MRKIAWLIIGIFASLATCYNLSVTGPCLLDFPRDRSAAVVHETHAHFVESHHEDSLTPRCVNVIINAIHKSSVHKLYVSDEENDTIMEIIMDACKQVVEAGVTESAAELKSMMRLPELLEKGIDMSHGLHALKRDPLIKEVLERYGNKRTFEASACGGFAFPYVRSLR